MSALAEAKSLERIARNRAWTLWTRQIVAILRMEVRKTFWGKGSLLVYLLALLPVLLMASNFVFLLSRNETAGSLRQIFAGIYELLILRMVIFFGCAWIFMNLFRGEVVDRSLHYYFLAPVRREVLVVGKYLSGLAAAMVVCLTSVAGALFFLYAARPSMLAADGEFRNVAAYLGVAVMGCIGYGAVFLLIGLLFRNPIIPALVIQGWEFINFLLPPVLKKISVIHYLHSLTPLPVDEGPLAILAEPTSAWISIPGFCLFVAVVLFLASRVARRMEISYGVD